MKARDYTMENAFCQTLKSGMTFENLVFGIAEFVGLDEAATKAAREQGHMCDMYTVRHSGFNYCWSSASVYAAVKGY